MGKVRENRTAVIKEVEKAEIIVRQIPAIKENEVLIKVHACNLCTSEYGIWTGKRTNRTLPWAFGHEWSGTVVEVGPEVFEFTIGDFVGGCYEFNPASRQSLMGQTLSDPEKKGFNKIQSDGLQGQAACGEYLVLPKQSVFKFTKELPPAEAAFLEPIATVYAGIKQLGIIPGDTVVVIGAGTMGLLNAEIAKFCGANVLVTEILPQKIAIAQAMGYQVIDSSQPDFLDKIKQQTNQRKADQVIVAVGVQAAMEQAFKIVKEFGGKIELFAAGYPDPEISATMNQLHYNRTALIGAFDADFLDFEIAARILATGRLQLKPLIEKIFPLEQVQEAFKLAATPGTYRVSVSISSRGDV
ncbi:zinc-dependent alcohol dehydrogenase [Candidatus Enterococcus ferrettii]|uniref:Enoyl reductase (ER) domain-containing protein n=1 Tax=Candidatus Enterococcus ferrettii TaxID=2815324 RepID=A0ABV0ELH2_9ENTE|nr:zinc-binding dehydrogenase [Enterococcus sp. 665A]MBO1339194.1 zinc-binding dehydrogenase [Enterococcus sp. 665A]